MLVQVRTDTRLDHETRVIDTARYIVENLDGQLDLVGLADRACTSRFHFHRIFQALLGETATEMARRLRLERAAVKLRTTSEPITEIAFDAGYATHEAFIRAFRAAFACSPTTFRKRLAYDGYLPTPNGLHFDDSACEALRFATPFGEPNMNIEVRDCEPRKAACISHSGPYYMIGKAFTRFHQELNGAAPGLGVALYYDDPAVVPADQLRSDAGCLVPDGYQVGNPEVHMVDIPGGSYAVGTYVGPYDGLNSAWNDLFQKWFLTSGYECAAGPAFEVYLDDCSTVAPSELRTELHVLVRKPAG